MRGKIYFSRFISINEELIYQTWLRLMMLGENAEIIAISNNKRKFSPKNTNISNADKLESFFSQNKARIEKSLDILETSHVSYLFSLASYKLYQRDLSNKIYDLSFEFLFHYLLDRSKTDPFLKKNFILIMQQAILLGYYRNYEEKYFNFIADIIGEYILRNHASSIRNIKNIYMLRRSSNSKNFLGVYSGYTDTKTIPPAFIQEKIANDLLSSEISDIFSQIFDKFWYF